MRVGASRNNEQVGFVQTTPTLLGGRGAGTAS